MDTTAQTAIGVCGFGRCGTTAVMTMLDAGGIRPVDGSQPVSYELPSVEQLVGLQVDQLAGRAVKLLDAPAYIPLPNPRPGFWRFVWLDRDARQQARSQVKLLAAVAGIDPDTVDVDVLTAGMRTERPERLGHLRSIGEVLVLSYEQLLANPRRAARHVAKLAPAGVTFDVDAAAAVVHNRDAVCLPDLAFEELPAHPHLEFEQLDDDPLTPAWHRLDDDTLLPVLPGVLPDVDEASQQRAMRQAHEDLPPVPGTQVRLLIASLDDGYRMLLEHGWTDDHVEQMRAHAAAVGGTDPHMVIAMRVPA